VSIATAMNAQGSPQNWVDKNDPQLAFMQANFETVAVAYQGVRVRNLTPVIQQGGEMTIGLTSIHEATVDDYDNLMNSSTAITHSNGDPGVIAQCAYVGNPDNDYDVQNTVSDYKFSEPGPYGINPESRCIFMRTFGSSAGANIGPQVYEIEIVTYYLGIPFGQNSQVFAPTRYDVSPSIVNRLMDEAYAKSPIFCIPRNFIKDDGWDTVWTGVKAIVQDVGLGLIGSAASAIGSAFLSLFDSKHRHRGFVRLLSLLPPEAYADFRKLLTDSPDHTTAMKSALAMRPPSRFSESDLQEVMQYLKAHSTNFEIVPVPPVSGGASSQTPGWFKSGISR